MVTTSPDGSAVTTTVKGGTVSTVKGGTVKGGTVKGGTVSVQYSAAKVRRASTGAGAIEGEDADGGSSDDGGSRADGGSSADGGSRSTVVSTTINDEEATVKMYSDGAIVILTKDKKGIKVLYERDFIYCMREISLIV
jgi:hypothetical protein